MKEKVLHIDFNPSIPLMYSIVNRLRAVDDSAGTKMSTWVNSGLGELALSVTTKIKMLDTIVRRTGRSISLLVADLKDEKKVLRTF